MNRSDSKAIAAPDPALSPREWAVYLEQEAAAAAAEGYRTMHYERPGGLKAVLKLTDSRGRKRPAHRITVEGVL